MSVSTALAIRSSAERFLDRLNLGDAEVDERLDTVFA
ncbi:hypothetical protein ABH994_008116 [Bradyrhizobium yuanmingense]|uniref:Uncharacterized protein n=1 Tax=Bradyrhizobium yuanmingense TaxID=108015 RepID=A0ABV4G8L5_9BRAD